MHLYQFENLVLLAASLHTSMGQGMNEASLSATTTTILLPYNHNGPAKFAPLNAENGGTIGEIAAHLVNDILVVELKSIERTGDSCVMTKELHRSSAGVGEEFYDFIDSEKANPSSFFFGTDMNLVRAFCDSMSLEYGNEQEWNGHYNIAGEVFFQCNAYVEDGVGNKEQISSHEQNDDVNNIAPESSLRARILRMDDPPTNGNVDAEETVVAHFEIAVACNIPGLDLESENEYPTHIANSEEISDQSSVCPEVDLTPCIGRIETCVADLLWDQRPLPYVPEEEDKDAKRIKYNGRYIWKYKVGYLATERAVGKPFSKDKHRALILTQPKVGTGAMWEAMSPVSDFLLRSHEVGILRPNSLWVPFPGCTAKPENGECTVVMAFRAPKTWLDSAYFQFRSVKVPRDSTPGSKEEVRLYHEFFRDPENRAKILDWWRIAEQLRLLGIPSESVTPFMESVMNNDGVQILTPLDLPNLPRWIRGCNVIVVQMEKAKYNSKTESVIRSILPDFHFQKPEENVGRVELRPELAAAYSAVKKATLPMDILEAMFQECPDFHEAWKLYYKDT